MRILIQRVKKASVTIEGRLHSAIENGILALVGFCESDKEEYLLPMRDKMTNLRIFEDADGKMNLSLKDVGGSLLAVSQFTLYADCRKGRRPSFTDAKNPAEANELYEKFVSLCSLDLGKEIGTGVFGADMKVELLNDGPVTIMLDSDEIVKN